MNVIKRRKLQWYGHTKEILHGIVKGKSEWVGVGGWEGGWVSTDCIQNGDQHEAVSCTTQAPEWPALFTGTRFGRYAAGQV